jgi:uncharacterized protein (TIGR02266 family)
VSASIEVKLRSPDGTRVTSTRIQNISLGGVFIEMAEPLPFGADVELEFTLPVEPRVICCMGFVVWSTRDAPERGRGSTGIGVRLIDIRVREMRLLNEFIERQLEP